VVWFGSEEIAAKGGADYFARHHQEKHVMAAESDFGADRIWRISTRVADPANAVLDRIFESLAPMGIMKGNNSAVGGEDVQQLGKSGVPIVALSQDGNRYFEIHHSADDTLDKIDIEQMRQNVAAWATVLSIASRAPDWPVSGTIEDAASQK